MPALALLCERRSADMACSSGRRDDENGDRRTRKAPAVPVVGDVVRARTEWRAIRKTRVDVVDQRSLLAAYMSTAITATATTTATIVACGVTCGASLATKIDSTLRA
jgi:hypothetical protein